MIRYVTVSRKFKTPWWNVRKQWTWIRFFQPRKRWGNPMPFCTLTKCLVIVTSGGIPSRQNLVCAWVLWDGQTIVVWRSKSNLSDNSDRITLQLQLQCSLVRAFFDNLCNAELSAAVTVPNLTCLPVLNLFAWGCRCKNTFGVVPFASEEPLQSAASAQCSEEGFRQRSQRIEEGAVQHGVVIIILRFWDLRRETCVLSIRVKKFDGIWSQVPKSNE